MLHCCHLLDHNTQKVIACIKTMIPSIHSLHSEGILKKRTSMCRSPAESSDLNPIENVWGSMETWLHNDAWKPNNLENLKGG